MSKPRVLIYDIETAPVQAYVWALFDQNVGLDQIKCDWSILSWSAKWLGEPAKKIMYDDLRNSKDMSDDSRLLLGIWKLLDEADVVVTQNGKKFDQKKLYARFIIAGMRPPSPSLHIDTRQLAKSKFGFTSNKLEYLTDKLNTKYKKLKHKKFPGFELWRECLAGNKLAWKEMEKYNKHDVLALEELYQIMSAWETSVNFLVFDGKCSCGSDKFVKNGFAYTSTGRRQKHSCKKCGKTYKSKTTEQTTLLRS